jgi:protein-S-isoprenylcysteine O-methyltransferase Ste14
MAHSTLWLVLNWIWIASEILIAIGKRTKRDGGIVGDRGSLAILWITIVAGMTASSWIGQTSRPNMLGGGYRLEVAGIVLIVVGLGIRWTAIISLGRSFSSNVAIRESQTIKSTGLYRFIRHPSYLGLLLILLAAGIHSRNWIGFAVALLPPTAALIYRIYVEEAALAAAFGEEYSTYCRNTKRLIPGVY